MYFTHAVKRIKERAEVLISATTSHLFHFNYVTQTSSTVWRRVRE